MGIGLDQEDLQDHRPRVGRYGTSGADWSLQRSAGSLVAEGQPGASEKKVYCRERESSVRSML